jgi:hypothetical protein
MEEYTALNLHDDGTEVPFVELSKEQRKLANRDFVTALGAVLLFACLVGLGAWYRSDESLHEEHRELPPIFPDCKSTPMSDLTSRYSRSFCLSSSCPESLSAKLHHLESK